MPALYDRIGHGYARTRRADPGVAQAIARELGPSRSGVLLDLACGTGNYTTALSAVAGSWTGVDVSETMLAQARQRSGTVTWVRASADRLPFANAAFDGVICTLAIHHLPALDLPFAEVRRTLGRGPFVIFTGLAEQMRHYWLCHYFPQTMRRSIERMPSESTIRAALARSGFESITVTPFLVTDELQDLFLYAGKHRPDLYLDPAVRANISSFAQLTPAAELQDGLARLSADIQSGAFHSIKARCATDLGDYAFITARAEG